MKIKNQKLNFQIDNRKCQEVKVLLRRENLNLIFNLKNPKELLKAKAT